MAIVSFEYQFLMEMTTDRLQPLNRDGFAVVISHQVFTADAMEPLTSSWLLGLMNCLEPSSFYGFYEDYLKLKEHHSLFTASVCS